MPKYSLPLDVMNRAAQHLKKPRFASPTSNSQTANELSFAYDKVRQYELQRNLWVFATREAVVRPVRNDTMLLAPTLWSGTPTYGAGQIVAYPAGTYWFANVANTNVIPGNATQDANGHLVWDSYFGPMTAERFRTSDEDNDSLGGWQSPIYPNANTGSRTQNGGYNAGELVYLPKGDGTAVVYQALVDTGEPPWFAAPWQSKRFYKAGDIAGWPGEDGEIFEPGSSDLDGPDVLGTTAYLSLSNLNVGNDPTLTNVGATPPVWTILTQYEPTAYVLGSDNQVYLCTAASLGDANLNPSAVGYNPVTDYGNIYWQPQHMYGGMWTSVIPAGVSISSKWQIVQATLVPITIAWPLSSGPAEDQTTLNVYKLPANWLRLAPDNPKTGITPWLGGPTFVGQKDWTFYANDWLVSGEIAALRLRFIADFQDVSRMDAMFAEAFALTLAQECAGACDADDELGAIAAKYRVIVVDARSVNAIEVGPVTPADDQYISVRY